MKLIDKDAVVAEIEKLKGQLLRGACSSQISMETSCKEEAYNEVLSFIDTFEVKEVDFEKLGEIARHLIAVKGNIEDMRLDKEEWFMLEKIGYPERFNTQKGGIQYDRQSTENP